MTSVLPPGRDFLWPIYMCTDLVDQLTDIKDRFNGVGYLMHLKHHGCVSVSDYFRNTNTSNFSVLLETCYLLSKRIASLHHCGLFHRDLSIGNILFNPLGGCVQVCDNEFIGFTSTRDNRRLEFQIENYLVGTKGFVAPEVLSKSAYYSVNTDNYSLAVCIYCLLTGIHSSEIDLRTYSYRLKLLPFDPSTILVLQELFQGALGDSGEIVDVRPQAKEWSDTLGELC